MKNEKNVVVTYNTPSPALWASSPSRGEGNNCCSLPPWRGKVGEARMRGQYKEEALNKNAFRAPLHSGFTLIELLVVVLIIGILAAIAVPQYQVAVEKARTTEALSMLSSMRKAMDLYILQNGYPPENTVLELEDLNLDLDFAEESKDFFYSIYLTESDLSVSACRITDEDYCIEYFAQPTEGWYSKECSPQSNLGRKVCNAIRPQL